MTTLLPFLLFDFGGTLADIHPNHEWLYQRACREFDVASEDERIKAAQAEGWDRYETPGGPAHPHISVSAEAFARYKVDVIVERLKAAGIQGPLPALAARILELDTEPDMYRLYDETLRVLQTLAAAGHAMGIVSNHEWDLPDLIDGLGLGSYFAVVVTSARVGYRKPHPIIYREALRLAGAAPENTVMIGDSMNADIAGARRLGMAAIFVDRSGGPLPAEAAPGVPAIGNLNELAGALQRAAHPVEDIQRV